MPFTAQQFGILQVLLYCTSIAGMLGALFVFITYLALKSRRSFGTNLVFIMSIANFGVSASFLPAFWIDGDVLCQVEGSIHHVSMVVSYIWGLFMGITFYAVFSQKFEEPKMRLARIVFLVAAIAYGAIGAGVIFGLEAYDSERLACWIDPQHMLYMIIFYFPLLLAPLINVLSFLAILTRHGRATFTTKYRFSMYLLIFITSHTFDALNKIHSTLYPGSPNFAFYILQSITFPCEGLYVAIMFVLTEPEIVDKYKEFFSRCCGRSSTFGTARAWEEMDSGYREVRGASRSRGIHEPNQSSSSTDTPMSLSLLSPLPSLPISRASFSSDIMDYDIDYDGDNQTGSGVPYQALGSDSKPLQNEFSHIL
jgi:hypothetical protein